MGYILAIIFLIPNQYFSCFLGFSFVVPFQKKANLGEFCALSWKRRTVVVESGRPPPYSLSPSSSSPSSLGLPLASRIKGWNPSKLLTLLTTLREGTNRSKNTTKKNTAKNENGNQGRQQQLTAFCDINRTGRDARTGWCFS